MDEDGQQAFGSSYKFINKRGYQNQSALAPKLSVEENYLPSLNSGANLNPVGSFEQQLGSPQKQKHLGIITGGEAARNY